MRVSLPEQALLDQLLHSPRLPVVAQQIEALLAEERAKRQQFIDATSEAEKAEFINGEKIVHSPVRLRHNITAKRLLILLDTYVGKHDLGYVGYEKMMISLTRNDYEPDICFFKAATASGFEPDQMRFPAPDLIIEVLSPSTEANDRGVKFDDYAAHGVDEYWLLDPVAEIIEQYRLVDGQYELAIKARSGEIRSIVLSDFVIPVRALFDDAINRETLRRLLQGEG